jgi:hypothetical protein
MAKRHDDRKATPPSISREEGKERFEAMRQKGRLLLESHPLVESAVQTWANTTWDYIKQTFGADSGHLATSWGAPTIRFADAPYVGYGRHRARL